MSRKAIWLIMLCILSPALVIATHSGSVCGDGWTQVNYLVALFEFQDLKHTISYEQIRDMAINQVQAYFDEVSYGKLKVVGQISDWTTLPYDVKNLDVFQWNFKNEDMWRIDSKAIDILDQLSSGLTYSTRFIVYAGKVWGHAYSSIKTVMVTEFHTTEVYCHELGHTLGLPDLYSYDLSRQGKYSGVNVGPWDLMGGPYCLIHMCAWSKLKLEWIENRQIVDVKDKYQGTFTIDPIESKDAKVLLVRVPVSDYQSYYVEVRERLGVDAKLDNRMRMGILIFLINDLLDAREGKVKVIDSHPASYPRAISAELFDAPFNIGRNETSALINREKNLSIIVLSKIGSSYKIMLADPATGEKAIEANSVIGQAQDAVQRAESESRLKGLDEAKSQLTKANSAYADSQFANSITAAKAAIELANAATKGVSVSTSTAAKSETTVAPTTQQDILLPAVLVIAALVVIGAFITLRKSKKSAPTPASSSTPSSTEATTPTPPATEYCVECGFGLSAETQRCPRVELNSNLR